MVDILMATYNGATHIAEQLDSLLLQSYADIRILVRDDGSTDDTLAVVNRYVAEHPNKVTLVQDGHKNLGVSKNFFQLLSHAQGDYTFFCDQDDVWLPTKVEKSIAKLKELEGSGGASTPAMVFTDLLVVDGNLETTSSSFWNNQKIDPAISQQLYPILAQNVVTGCTIGMNKALREHLIPLETNAILHDHWVAIQACYHGAVSFIPEALIKYRQHGNNELGAKKIGVNYFLEKALVLPRLYQTWKREYPKLGIQINYVKLLWTKISLNLKRALS